MLSFPQSGDRASRAGVEHAKCHDSNGCSLKIMQPALFYLEAQDPHSDKPKLCVTRLYPTDSIRDDDGVSCGRSANEHREPIQRVSDRSVYVFDPHCRPTWYRRNGSHAFIGLFEPKWRRARGARISSEWPSCCET